MDSNQRNRAPHAVACSLSRLPGGRIHLTLDDIRSLAPENEGLWQHEVFVTAKEYDEDRLSALELPEEEFAAFGYMVMARLLAANRLLKLRQT